MENEFMNTEKEELQVLLARFKTLRIMEYETVKNLRNEDFSNKALMISDVKNLKKISQELKRIMDMIRFLGGENEMAELDEEVKKTISLKLNTFRYPSTLAGQNEREI